MGKTKKKAKAPVDPKSSPIKGTAFTQAVPRSPSDPNPETVEHYAHILKADPENLQALKVLAHTLHSLGRYKEALKYFVQAVMLQPQDTQLLCDLADTWQAAGHFPQAIAAYEKALELTRDLPRALYSLGCAYLARKEYRPACVYFQRVIAAQPECWEARHNWAATLYQLGQVTEAMAQFRQCAARPEGAMARAMIAVIIPGAPEADNAAILEARRFWVQQDLSCVGGSAFSQQAEHKKQLLRIGYISSFFAKENWMKPVWGLINQHDRQQFEIHLFSDAPVAQIQSGYRPHPADQFYDITALSNEAVIHLIRQCELDILVDLNGYSRMQRFGVLTSKIAPVLVGWFNLYATTGLPTFDYLIGDEQVIPIEEEAYYTEKILRVPGSYLTFAVNYPVPEVTDPPCLTKGTVTFGCLASQYKLTDEVIAAWCRILRQSPASSLLLRNSALGSASLQDWMWERFAQQGIGRERIHLHGPTDHYQFLQTYDLIDIALDPFPYNGGTTTTEAIWQGVPVLTFRGDRWASRTSASLLHAAGLPQFIAADQEGYIVLATQLANSADTGPVLMSLRRTMRAQLRISPVCDTLAFAREMEYIYQRIRMATALGL
jgi:protein O-GlcNAc transferase